MFPSLLNVMTCPIYIAHRIKPLKRFCQQQELNYVIMVWSFCYNVLSYFRVFQGVIAAAVTIMEVIIFCLEPCNILFIPF